MEEGKAALDMHGIFSAHELMQLVCLGTVSLVLSLYVRKMPTLKEGLWWLLHGSNTSPSPHGDFRALRKGLFVRLFNPKYIRQRLNPSLHETLSFEFNNTC